MTLRRGYVLLTCLYLLALAAIAGLAAMQASSLMARHALLVDRHSNNALQVRAGVAQVESHLVHGQELVSLDVRETPDGCEVDPGIWFRVSRLRVLPAILGGGDSETRQANLVIYEIRACEAGRARIETSVAVVEPISSLDDTSLRPEIRPGRLSWREVW